MKAQWDRFTAYARKHPNGTLAGGFGVVIVLILILWLIASSGGAPSASKLKGTQTGLLGSSTTGLTGVGSGTRTTGSGVIAIHQSSGKTGIQLTSGKFRGAYDEFKLPTYAVELSNVVESSIDAEDSTFQLHRDIVQVITQPYQPGELSGSVYAATNGYTILHVAGHEAFLTMTPRDPEHKYVAEVRGSPDGQSYVVQVIGVGNPDPGTIAEEVARTLILHKLKWNPSLAAGATQSQG